MNKFKAWWVLSAWPWLKENWMWVLFPIGIIMLVVRLLPHAVVTLDPVVKADARAKAERELRDAQLQAERDRLEAELAKVHREHELKLRTLTQEQMDHVSELQQDPEALNRYLRSL